MLAVAAGCCRRVLGLLGAQSGPYGHAAAASEATGRRATRCRRVRRIIHYARLSVFPHVPVLLY